MPNASAESTNLLFVSAGMGPVRAFLYLGQRTPPLPTAWHPSASVPPISTVGITTGTTFSDGRLIQLRRLAQAGPLNWPGHC